MRVYKWPPEPPHDLEVVGVTSIIGAGIPKPFLAPWSAKMVAEYAVDKLDSWAGLAKEDPKAAVDLLKRSPYRSTAEKADMGTIVHVAVEAYVRGEPLSDEQLAEELTERRVPQSKWRSTRGYVKGAVEFLSDLEPEILHSEATVYSREHGYAGTADLIAKLRVGKSRRPVVIDYKTSKAIYDEVGLQLCAYSRADFVGLNDGTELPMPKNVRDGLAVRLTPTGRYEPAPFTLTDELFEVFLAARSVALGEDAIKNARRPRL
jgi:hypothetical protein